MLSKTSVPFLAIIRWMRSWRASIGIQEILLACRVYWQVLTIVLVLVLQGCGGKVDGDSGSVPPPTEVRLDSAAGGELVVRGTGSALDGMRVSVPPGAFASASVTITVREASALPVPIAAKAVSAGLIQASVAAAIEATESGRFRRRLTVTFPFDGSKVGDGEFPVVAFFDAALGKYQFVATTGVDRAAKTVTFETDHFSMYAVFTIPGLRAALNGLGPFPAGVQKLSAQGFTPEKDGFPVQNFSTYKGDLSSGGVCYGQAVYAAYYFERHALRGPQSLFAKYKTSTNSIPQVDDRAREVSNAAFIATEALNRNTIGFALPPIDDVDTAATMITVLAASELPQVVSLFENRGIWGKFYPGFGHTVVAYKWDSDKRRFLVYDPNVPYDKARPTMFESRYLTFGLDKRFERYDDAYSWVLFDPQGSAAVQLDAVFEFGEKLLGLGVSREFDTIRVISPAATTDSAGGVFVAIDPNAASTSIVLEWIPKQAGDAYAHIYLDGADVGIAPIHTGVGPAGIPRRFEVPVPRLPAYGSLEVAISTVANEDSSFLLPQAAVSYGYQGFLRVALGVGTCVSVQGPNWSFSGEVLNQVCNGSLAQKRFAVAHIPDHAYLSQVGCSVYFGSTPGQDRLQGTISGTSISYSTNEFLPEGFWPGFVFAANRRVGRGHISGDLRRIDMRLEDYVSGTWDGIFGSCSVEMKVTWERR